MKNIYVIEDTITNKYLDYDGASDNKIWVESIDSAHKFSEADCNIVLSTLNTPTEPNRFIGRPGDRGA